MARCFSDWSGDSVFRYPAPETSSGNSAATAGSTPKRSRRVLPYSTFVNRRITNAPGSIGVRYLIAPTQSENICRSASVGCFFA